MTKNSKKIKTVTPSIIGAEMYIIGDISGEGAIDISGKVDGNIKCLSIKLLAGSSVTGDLTAEKAEIHGEVRGNVTAKTIVCGATAKIVGDIIHQRINIEDGAHIDGNCRKFVVEPSEEEKTKPGLKLVEEQKDKEERDEVKKAS